MSRLDELDLSQKLSREEADRRLVEAQERLLALRLVLGGLVGERGIGPPVCVPFEGWDASGKGGAIQRVVVRPRARGARGGFRVGAAVEARLRGDRRLRADARRGGRDPRQV